MLFCWREKDKAPPFEPRLTESHVGILLASRYTVKPYPHVCVTQGLAPCVFL